MWTDGEEEIDVNAGEPRENGIGKLRGERDKDWYLIEGYVVRPDDEEGNKKRAWEPSGMEIWRFIGCFILTIAFGLIVIFIMVFGPSIQYNPAKKFEAAAKGVLMNLGKAEMEYLNTHNGTGYGSWDQLNENYEQWGRITRGNIIEGYSLWVGNGSYATPAGKTIYSFTAVAFPSRGMRRALRTFAIREDQIIRLYHEGPDIKAWGEDGDYGAKSWEPIR